MTRQPTATAGRWQKEKAQRDLSSVRSAHRRSAFTRPRAGELSFGAAVRLLIN